MKKIFLTIATILLLVGCGDGSRQKDAADKRASWIESMQDSTVAISDEMEFVNSQIEENKQRVDSMLPMFEVVDNSRYVESYTVYRGWKNYDTGAKTGLIVRLRENTVLELVATCREAFFDYVGIEVGAETASSDVVPYDKALNYRIGNTNIVAFSGDKIEELCRIVSENEGKEIKFFFRGNKATKSIVLTAKQKEMIAGTYRLWKFNEDARRGNMQLQFLANKLEIFKKLIDEKSVKNETNSEQ